MIIKFPPLKNHLTGKERKRKPRKAEKVKVVLTCQLCGQTARRKRYGSQRYHDESVCQLLVWVGENRERCGGDMHLTHLVDASGKATEVSDDVYQAMNGVSRTHA